MDLVRGVHLRTSPGAALMGVMTTNRADVPIRLIAVPYHLGRPGVGMGEGPDRLLDAGAVDRLRARGHAVDLVSVELPDPF